MRGKGREEKRRKREERRGGQRTERLNAKYVREPPEKSARRKKRRESQGRVWRVSDLSEQSQGQEERKIGKILESGRKKIQRREER